MPDLKKRIHIFQKPHLQVAGVLVLIGLALLLLVYNSINSTHAVGAMIAQVRFEGEYRIEDGQWQPIREGEHIPATKGDVTLRGNFHIFAPDGEYAGLYTADTPIAFYTDHINLIFRQGDGESNMIDHENSMYGISACGTGWTAYSFLPDCEDPIEITVHNPHRFGNERAIDEMIANVAIWDSIDFEKSVIESGKTQQNTGLFFIILSFVMLGSALLSALLRIQTGRIIWLFGATILMAGIYLRFNVSGVAFWSEYVDFNTSILGFSMMFYMLFIAGIITYSMKETKKVGYITTAVLGVADGVYIILPVLSGIPFYDMWLPWIITQGVANVVYLVCLIKESISAEKKDRWIRVGLMLTLVCYAVDVFATAEGFWKGGVVSKYIFFVLFVAALFVVLRFIPESINATMKAKELELQRSRLEAEKSIVEAELKESRISIMLSQIQPHFIYNTLGTIERMCLRDPEKAFELVRNFSLYLRGNFSELNNVIPIQFEEELKHVEYYVNIEKVRFPDMNIVYDVKTTGFLLPALSVQPLVENAIKHGLMRLESGGTVVIRSYETDKHYCIEVKDNGVGFDTSQPIDEKKHVGLCNIRGRLKAMVSGELLLESTIGVGTCAVIMIPKEVTE